MSAFALSPVFFALCSLFFTTKQGYIGVMILLIDS